mmetsp:Transcript_53154/g.140437  ORF Transcript_53154/g.140437 Transcript_53154/m.140437 type:complete len:345 (+) Transcript_53154:2617-3651(+)
MGYVHTHRVLVHVPPAALHDRLHRLPRQLRRQAGAGGVGGVLGPHPAVPALGGVPAVPRRAGPGAARDAPGHGAHPPLAAQPMERQPHVLHAAHRHRRHQRAVQGRVVSGGRPQHRGRHRRDPGHRGGHALAGHARGAHALDPAVGLQLLNRGARLGHGPQLRRDWSAAPGLLVVHGGGGARVDDVGRLLRRRGPRRAQPHPDPHQHGLPVPGGRRGLHRRWSRGVHLLGQRGHAQHSHCPALVVVRHHLARHAGLRLGAPSPGVRGDGGPAAAAAAAAALRVHGLRRAHRVRPRRRGRRGRPGGDGERVERARGPALRAGPHPPVPRRGGQEQPLARGGLRVL